jgi:hypothetical protein
MEGGIEIVLHGGIIPGPGPGSRTNQGNQENLSLDLSRVYGARAAPRNAICKGKPAESWRDQTSSRQAPSPRVMR